MGKAFGILKIINRRFRASILSSLGFFVLAGSAPVGATTPDTPSEHLTIAAYSSPPAAWFMQDGSIAGTSALWVNGFFEAVGESYEFSYRLGSSQRIRTDLISGRADCAIIGSASILNPHTTVVAQLEPLPVGVWSMKDTPIKSVEEIRQKRLSTSYTYRKLVEPYADQVHFVATTGKLLYMLISGRTDGIVSVNEFIRFRLHQLGTPKEKFHHIPFGELEVAFLCSNKSKFVDRFPRWREQGARYNAEMTTQKREDELFKRYDSDPKYRWVENHE